MFTDLPEGERCPIDSGQLIQVTDRTLQDEHSGRICDEKYEIGRLLGVGGMGCVHEAVNLRLDQQVAVKFFSPRAMCQPGRDAAEAAERFRREATVMAKARHPNVVHVLDFSIEADGTMYIVMELLEGEPLDQRLTSGTMTVGQGLSVLSSVVKALEFVHAQGIVHRDLKPSNIFCAEVAGRESVKVLDFGIARLADCSTLTNGPLGTWRYAAPEQLEGEAVGPAADVYSLGIILVEMLAGRPATRGKGLDQLPGPLSALAATAIDDDPTDRPDDGREFGLALARATEELSAEELSRPLPPFQPEISSAPPRPFSEWVERARTPTPVLSSAARAETPEPEPTAPTPAPRWPMMIAGLVAGVGLTALALVVFGVGPGREVEPPETTPASSEAAPTTASATDDGGPVATITGDAGLEGGDAGRGPVMITFRSAPEQAAVVRIGADGEQQQLCITECAEPFERSTEPLEVVFRARGYRNHRVELTADRDRTIEANLKRRVGATSPRNAAPTTKAAAPEAGAAMGYLTVRLIPQCDVYLDGRHLGHSPLIRRPVTAGQHHLRVVPRSESLGPGVTRSEKQRTVTITAEQTTTIVDYW